MTRNSRAARTGGILIALGFLLVCATLGNFTLSVVGLGLVFLGLLLAYPYLTQREDHGDREEKAR